MRATALAIDGALVIDVDAQADERGIFARTYCADELAALGVMTTIAQQSISWNDRAGTLRGMHWQDEPHGDDKLVRCTSGRTFDAIADVRRGSASFGVIAYVELDASRHNAVYIPRGVAHGFITLEPSTELLYQMSSPFVPAAQRGMRWDDPGLNIPWPSAPTVISMRDATYPDHIW